MVDHTMKRIQKINKQISLMEMKLHNMEPPTLFSEGSTSRARAKSKDSFFKIRTKKM